MFTRYDLNLDPWTFIFAFCWDVRTSTFCQWVFRIPLKWNQATEKCRSWASRTRESQAWTVVPTDQQDLKAIQKSAQPKAKAKGGPVYFFVRPEWEGLCFFVDSLSLFFSVFVSFVFSVCVFSSVSFLLLLFLFLVVVLFLCFRCFSKCQTGPLKIMQGF